MQNKLKFYRTQFYILFIIIILTKTFFSTDFSYADSFEVDNIEISKRFDINFNKNDVIDEGFNLAFKNLILKIIKIKDQKKLDSVSSNQLKGMIDYFSIKEEKFINDNYHVSLDVNFSKKKVYAFLEKQNIFPSLPKKSELLLIPVLIDENINELTLFSENIFFNYWNNKKNNYSQLNYVLPVEDLDDINIIKNKFEFIEDYDFERIIKKYPLNDYIVVLFYKSKNSLKVLSKINFNKKRIIDNQVFIDFNFKNIDQIENTIISLKNIYEDYWKENNEINTSIKLPLTIAIDSKNNKRISSFENDLFSFDLVSYFGIYKIDNKKTFYKIIFNGTPKSFILQMQSLGYQLDLQNQIWIIE